MRRRPDTVRDYRDAFTERDRIHELDALGARAWPALAVLDLDGWRLRTARGFTKRANSVWPRAFGDRLDLETKLANVERYYWSRGLPARFLMSPVAAPKGLDRVLAGRGYARSEAVEVRTAALEDVPGVGRLPAAGVELFEEPTGRWLAAWTHASGGGAAGGLASGGGAGEGASGGGAAGGLASGGGAGELVARARASGGGAAGERASARGDRGDTGELAARILARVEAPSVYALAHVAGEDVAVARGVLDGGWLGVADVATAEDHRGRGIAVALLGALAWWAAGRGAEQAWLAVEASNAAGVALYRERGFKRAYTYRYRSRAGGPGR